MRRIDDDRPGTDGLCIAALIVLFMVGVLVVAALRGRWG